MQNTPMTPVTAIETIAPISRRTDASEVALSAYGQLFALLDTLSPADWATPTPDCPPWTVADMVGHLIGAARACASMRENVRQQMWGMRHKADFDGNALDALNSLQIADHAALSPAERVDRLKAVAPKAVRGRMRTPSLFRRINLRMPAGGSTAAGMPSSDTLGHLMDVIYTRDIWLHTIDIARAVGREPDVTGAVNARIVADVVAEWAARHGQPVTLILDGPAGGVFRHGVGGPQLKYDAVEFCRVLSGRGQGSGLLGSRVVF
jgi:uncharacterized protein (TIGR03083 family)